MNFDEALRYLLSLGHETVAIKLGLTNTERLLDALSQPQNDFPSVQIAGTNGKGSTAVVLERICRASGIKTGLYTSPHLISITERIRTGGLEITPPEFARLMTLVHDAARRLLEEGQLPALPTFFEHVTAAALVAFSEARVQLAILETGLGGRLDATTAALARTVAITPIALDHQEYLGQTLPEIAAEKAAIIRPGVTAIIAPQPPLALEVILRQCAEKMVAPHLVDDQQVRVINADASGRLRITLKTGADCYENVRVGLRGRHQLTNVAVAVTVAEALRARGFQIPRAAIIEGIESAEHWGRLEMWEGRPSLLFDGAHNPAGAQALRAYLDEFVHVPITLIFGAMRDKALDEIAATLFPAASRLIFTEPHNPRAAPPEEIEHAVPPGIDSSRITLEPSTAHALRIAFVVTPTNGLILITGSLYLVGEIRRTLREQAARPFL
ncbi:MAG: bifunctional folylpolyglutamate synthase/dihydrofolate synthase [Acidobacteria bacterium]|nr:bifunctional folylpolyglutamate synthase/dihydrofolate synthase [Acidobacteriota bacterium]